MSTVTVSREEAKKAFAEMLERAHKPMAQVSATQLIVNWPGQGYFGMINLPQAGSLTVNLAEPPAGTTVQIYHQSTGVWTDVAVGLHTYSVGQGDSLCWQLPGALSYLELSWMY